MLTPLSGCKGSLPSIKNIQARYIRISMMMKHRITMETKLKLLLIRANGGLYKQKRVSRVMCLVRK